MMKILNNKAMIMYVTCGTENLNGKLELLPLDEKNLTTDWITDFLFDCNFAIATNDTRYCGFISLDECRNKELLCEVCYDDYTIEYRFPCINYLSSHQIKFFCDALEEYFKENELTIKVMVFRQKEGLDFEPQISIRFYSREESRDK